jgi:hypothetical protein
VGCLARLTEHRQRALQQRYLAAAAQADARRRRLVNILLGVFIISSFIAAGYTLHQEQRIQQMEQMS